MRITISSEDLTPGQWDWLLRNVRQDYDPKADDIRMCVTFVRPDSPTGEIIHREMKVWQWVSVIHDLDHLTRTASAALRPDSLADAPPVWPPYGA